MGGDAAKLEREPRNYFRAGEARRTRVLAHGRDPYFPGWPDTVQLDYRRAETQRSDDRRRFSPSPRSATACAATWRCSSLHDIFSRTWGGKFEPAAASSGPSRSRRIKARASRLPVDGGGVLGHRVRACSSRASTSLTTSVSTTGCSRDDADGVRVHLRADRLPEPPRALHREPRRAARRRKSSFRSRARRWPRSCFRCPDCASSTRVSSRAGGRSSPSISDDARTSRSTRTLEQHYRRLLAALARDSFTKATGGNRAA